MADDPKLDVRIQDGVRIVTFGATAALDTATIRAISPALYDLVGGDDHAPIALDLTPVCFLSSQALGVLLNFRRRAETAGIDVALVGVRADLIRLFEITNLDQLFVFCENTDDAVARLAGR